jgi:hypothetical protein
LTTVAELDDEAASLTTALAEAKHSWTAAFSRAWGWRVIEVDRILKQLDAVLARHERAVDAYPNDLPLSKVKELLTSAQAAIERLAPPRSAYAVNCKVALKEHSPIEWHLEVLMGIVTASGRIIKPEMYKNLIDRSWRLV